MVACLLRSRDIYDEFTKTYGKTTGIISKQEKKARLLAITTSSSMARSSVYNRLKLGGIEYFRSIGYTGGWGISIFRITFFGTFANISGRSVIHTRT